MNALGLSDLLERAAYSDAPLVTRRDLRGLPEGALAQLLRWNVLRPASPAETWWCDACDQPHSEEVEYLSAARAFIRCPEQGRVAVDVEGLRQWRVDVAGVAHFVSVSLGLRTQEQELVPGRLWLLGAAMVGGVTTEVFVARWWEEPADHQFLGAASLPTVLVGTRTAGASTAARIVSLGLLVNLSGDGLAFDRAYFEAAQPAVARALPTRKRDPGRPSKYSEPQKRKFIREAEALRVGGKTWREVRTLLGVTDDEVRRWKQEFGMT